jgi:hypothetical protein
LSRPSPHVFWIEDFSGDNPLLGIRYREAIADIIPGECSVPEDDIIITPAYHNALNRRATEAATYMRPLFESTQDFKQLVQENVLLGIANKIHARFILRNIHTEHWNRRTAILQEVLDGNRTADSVRPLINRWHQEWAQETREAQQNLQQRYAQMQEERKQKFDPIAEQAIVNARESIMRAQCDPPKDIDQILEALQQLLQAAKQEYERTLDARIPAYQQTQSLFADPNNPLFPEIAQAATWQDELRRALTAFDQGNPDPLRQFIANIPLKDRGGFSAGWRLTYNRHADQDEAEDNRVRLGFWNTALELPKTEATDCAKEHMFHESVVTTWCESGEYEPGEIIIRGAPIPIKAFFGLIRPPDTSDLDGYDTVIDESQVVGSSCSGSPGDPWWAEDCSCHCGQLVPAEDGRLLPCRVVEEVPEHQPVGEESDTLIIRHDIRVTSREECLLQREHHRDRHF